VGAPSRREHPLTGAPLPETGSRALHYAPRMPAALPTGTVTFLFTDIEGSTELLRRLGDEAFDRAYIEGLSQDEVVALLVDEG